MTINCVLVEAAHSEIVAEMCFPTPTTSAELFPRITDRCDPLTVHVTDRELVG